MALLSLAGFAGSAQQKVFELPMDPADADGLQVYHAFDPQGARVHITFASHFKVQRYVLDSDDSTVHTPVPLTGPLVYDKSSRSGSILPFYFHLGHSFVKGGIEEAFSDKVFSKIVFINSPYNSQPVQRTDSILIPAGEHLFVYFHQQNEFYALTHPKGSDTIRIYHHRPGGRSEVVSKRVGVKDWGKIAHRPGMLVKNSVRELSDLIDGLSMIVQDPYMPPLLLATLSRTKLFVTAGKAYLTFDNTDLDTYVAEIPLDSREVRIMKFDALPYYHNTAPPNSSNGNSFIIDSTLVVASVIHQQLYLAFFDLSTGQLKAAYEPGKDGSLSYSHSPFLHVGTQWKKSTVYEIKREAFVDASWQFWSLGISGHKYGRDQIQLEIGTNYYREGYGKAIVSVNTVGSYSTMRIGAGMPGGAMYAATGGGRQNTMLFMAQFQAGDCSSLPYKELEDKSELINNFVDSLKKPRREIAFLGFEGKYWLGFYEPSDKKYLIYKF